MALCAGAVAGPGLASVQSSPQRRTQQSASILAYPRGLVVEIVPALDELDFGDWTGLSFDELGAKPRWRRWNERRGQSSPPHGETMRQLQFRMVDHLERLQIDYPDARVAVVSHAEPIRAALLHYLGIPLNEFFTVEVDPASISTLLMDGGCVHVLRVNEKAFS